MDLPVRNIEDLRNEVTRLKGLEHEQSAALAQRFSSPSKLFATIYSLFPKAQPGPDGKNGGFFDQDIMGLISRIVLPFTLNKTLFKNSNFIVKTLVGLVSQKASHFITEDSVVSLWDKVKGLFHKKEAEPHPEHKGVPPLSETY